MDLLLDFDTKDLIFDNGKCPVTKGKVVTAQRLLIRLRTFLGEWWLNTGYGVPYQRVLGRKVSKTTVDTILQEEIYKDSGVRQITYFQSSLNPMSRTYVCDFRVRVDTGEESETIRLEV